MKKLLTFCCIGFIALSVAFVGCSQEKSASSSEAINTAKAMESIEDQAEMFYASQEYKDAVSTAQYVLNAVDKKSQKAQELLDKSKSELSRALKDMLKGSNK